MNLKIDEWSGASAVRELHATIEKFNETSDRQARAMLWLTRVIAVLTAVMTVGLCVQIYLAVRSPAPQETRQ